MTTGVFKLIKHDRGKNAHVNTLVVFVILMSILLIILIRGPWKFTFSFKVLKKVLKSLLLYEHDHDVHCVTVM